MSKSSATRDKKAIQAVACPDCGAARGQLCYRRREDGTGPMRPQTQYGRPMVCKGRRVAWQMVRDGEAHDTR